MHDSLPTKLAFTDLETSGVYPPSGEIIEIGLIVADATSLKEIDRLDIKVKPKHIETAVPESVRISGYRPEDWERALTIEEGLRQFVDKARGATFCTWRVAFDFAFMQAALYDAGLLPVEHIRDHYCVYTMALYALRDKNISPFRSKQVAEYLGLPPEPQPHRAIHGAEQTFAIYKKLMALS